MRERTAIKRLSEDGHSVQIDGTRLVLHWLVPDTIEYDDVLVSACNDGYAVSCTGTQHGHIIVATFESDTERAWGINSSLINFDNEAGAT